MDYILYIYILRAKWRGKILRYWQITFLSFIGCIYIYIYIIIYIERERKKESERARDTPFGLIMVFEWPISIDSTRCQPQINKSLGCCIEGVILVNYQYSGRTSQLISQGFKNPRLTLPNFIVAFEWCWKPTTEHWTGSGLPSGYLTWPWKMAHL